MAPLLLLLPFLLLLSSPYVQAQHNITLGSSLTPLGRNSFWLSPSGDFAFGFRPMEGNTSSYLLAVWFNKISDKTVAWYAKTTTDPDAAPVQVPSGSRLQLISNGALSLQDPTGTEVWNPKVVGAAYAAMLDTGNFVLAAADGSTKWGAFHNPADTILLTQVLTPETKLHSRIITTDYSNRHECSKDSSRTAMARRGQNTNPVSNGELVHANPSVGDHGFSPQMVVGGSVPSSLAAPRAAPIIISSPLAVAERDHMRPPPPLSLSRRPALSRPSLLLSACYTLLQCFGWRLFTPSPDWWEPVAAATSATAAASAAAITSAVATHLEGKKGRLWCRLGRLVTRARGCREGQPPCALKAAHLHQTPNKEELHRET
nr:unnamed protein product [Digitaria exilis]